MSMRVAGALVVHELTERVRDRWVLVVTALFVLLASGIGLYGRAAEDSAAAVTAPSLVTLCAFLVPLVALVLGHDAVVGERERHTLGLLLSLPVGRGEVLLAKYVGRAIALSGSIGLGLGSAALLVQGGQRQVLVELLLPTMLLGAVFLSLGMLLSTVARRHATAASMAVALWFILVFFYDLGLLGALVATGGAISNDVVTWLVAANPAGLYRTTLLVQLSGTAAMEEAGILLSLPGAWAQAALWLGWTVIPLAIGALLLTRRRAVTA